MRSIKLLLPLCLTLLVASISAPSPAFAAPKKKAAKAAAVKAPAAKKSAAAKQSEDDVTQCSAKLLVDAATGDVLFEENAHQPLPPASMVKLMLAYVTLKKVQDGAVKLTDPITASAACSKIGGSQVFLKEGELFTLSQLLEAVLIQSANDASLAIAEHIGGTREGFVDMMNQEAKALGMNESTFHSPHGLPPSDGQNPDVVSANDFAILGRALMANYPQVIELTKRTDAGFRNDEFKMSNHNHLLRSFPGCDGLKTGYYGEAGFSITATAERNGLRMLAVVMGCKNRKNRDSETARLLSSGFGQYKQVKLIEKGSAIEQSVPVVNGTLPSVAAVAAADVTGLIRPGQEQSVQRSVQLCTGLQAPVEPNTPCGTVTLTLGKRVLGTAPLAIPEPVPVAGMTVKVKRYLGF